MEAKGLQLLVLWFVCRLNRGPKRTFGQQLFRYVLAILVLTWWPTETNTSLQQQTHSFSFSCVFFDCNWDLYRQVERIVQLKVN